MSAEPAPRREDLPDGSVKIWLARPIFDQGANREAVVIRLPTAAERWEIGDPRGFIYDARGELGTPYVDRPLLQQWLRKLVTGIDIDVLGREQDIALAILIEEAVLDFFARARMRLSPPSAPSQDPGQPPVTSQA